MDRQHIYTVSELNGVIRNLLENRFPFLSVSGEISNLRKPYSGHLYFTLKDDRGRIKAVLFKMQQRYLEQQPADGQSVICRGRISVYEPRGDYQLIVDQVDFHGAGNLQIAFEQLKKKLAEEGLFAEEAKKKLPALPGHITLITSPQGAAVHDFIRIANRRFPGTGLAVYPVAVQGDGAAAEIIRALKQVNSSLNTDIIVLCRGGGSIEDLQPFNDEQLARTIYGSKIPVVSAIGHEIDFTIADFVSDLRAPTPSAAAELLLPDARVLAETIHAQRNRLLRLLQERLHRSADRLALQQQRLGDFSTPLANLFIKVDQESMRLSRGMENILHACRQRVGTLELRLERQNPDNRLQLSISRLASVRKRLIQATQHCIASNIQVVDQQKNLLEAISPHATLARGYAIVRKKNTSKVVTDSAKIKPGQRAEVLLHRGRLDVTVDSCSRETKT